MTFPLSSLGVLIPAPLLVLGNPTSKDSGAQAKNEQTNFQFEKLILMKPFS